MLHEVGAAVAGTDGRLPATSNLTVNLSERVSAWGLLGYGRGGPWDVGVATPYGGLALSEAGWRLGPDVSLGIEGTKRPSGSIRSFDLSHPTHLFSEHGTLAESIHSSPLGNLRFLWHVTNYKEKINSSGRNGVVMTFIHHVRGKPIWGEPAVSGRCAAPSIQDAWFLSCGGTPARGAYACSV